MRWEYREPEKKTFVSDGKTFYFYVPADRQVIVPRAGRRARPAGHAALRPRRHPRHTSTSPRRRRPAGACSGCGSTPRKAEPEIEHLYVDVDADDRIRAILVVDAQGNRSQFAFDAIRENVGLEDRLFRFEVPRGVEVITG